MHELHRLFKPIRPIMELPLERERVERRLMAILATDVVGYSRLIGADDEGTLAQLKAHHNALIGPKIREYRGRIIRTTGDGLLVLFASVVDALRCAVEVQRGMIERNAQALPAQRIEFRMGISVGDIIVDGRDIHGDGVNVAARLEALAEPGGICVSERVREDVQSKFDIAFVDAGQQQLKNISRPVRVYRVRLSEAEPKATSQPPDNPQIAVLPAPSRRAERPPGHVHGKVDQETSRWSATLRLILIYAVTPIVALLLAHYLIVMKLDVNTAFLRVFSLLIPLFGGFMLFWQTGQSLGIAFLLGTITGVVSVCGMLAIVGLVESTTVVPSSPFEWQEAIEYAVGIALATMFGSALARAVNAALSKIPNH